MAIVRERNDLDKKWTWYLFLLANVCVLIGCAATWMMISKGNANLLWLPTVICNLAAIAAAIAFMLLEAKEIMPKSMHFKKKWIYWYLAAMITFVCAIIFSVVYYMMMIDGSKDFTEFRGAKQWVLIVYFVITGVLTLTAIGLQRYARFRIDLDVLRRKQGQIPNKEETKDSKKEDKKESKKKPTTDKKASGGLLEEMDKK